MTQLGPRRWTKRYPNPESCQTAATHHQWLAGLGAPVPRLHAISEDHLEFDHVAGRHAQSRDLLHIADLLGRVHNAAYTTDLHRAQLDRSYTTSTGLTIPDFLTPRRRAITTLLTNGFVPAAPFTADQALRELQAAAQEPVCLYKDSNPRNFLITTTDENKCVLVDFDVLTLAPAGYDLAKLVVTLTMTHGPLPTTQIQAALSAYNTTLAGAAAGLEPVPWAKFMTWADIHHILTSPYLGRGGYRHTWISSATPVRPPLLCGTSGCVLGGVMGQHDDDSGPGSGDKGDDRRRDEGKDTSRHSVEDDKQTATTPNPDDYK